MAINSNNISINNFNNLCRTCAQTNDLISIKENIYLIDMLSTSVSLQVQLNDDLPQRICINCINDLNQSYTFIGKCKAADAAFRQCLTQQKLLNLSQNKDKQKPENVTTTTTAEEIYIKTEYPENYDYCSNSPQYNEIEDEGVTTNNDFQMHLNDCQFKSLNETMETEESRDGEDPLIVSNCSLPEKSRAQYERERNLFNIYCKESNVTNITEPVVLDYFLKRSNIVKASSLWVTYTLLKKTIMIDDNVDISKYTKLLEFLKRNSVGYKAKVTKTFTRDQINRFLREAPDKTHLLLKVALIMGIAGGCRLDELTYMTLDHVVDKDSITIVTIKKTSTRRTFLITNCEFDWLGIYRKFHSLRTSFNTEQKRLFLNYKNGKFSNQPVGINTFGKFPKLIAEFLNLATPDQYTGHCFRRSSALLFNRRRHGRKVREDF